VKFFQRPPLLVLAVVLLWRVLLLIFTVQPIPSNDAFGYDGAVINFLHGGAYCNPSFALLFPISGREVYSGYPPMYQAALLLWMMLFGTGMISAMILHLALFALSGFLTLAIIQGFFPAATGYALVALLLFGFTFVDRPDSLAYVFGLGSLWLVARQISFPSPNSRGGGHRSHADLIPGSLHFGHRGSVFFWRGVPSLRRSLYLAPKPVLVRSLHRSCGDIRGHHLGHRETGTALVGGLHGERPATVGPQHGLASTAWRGPPQIDPHRAGIRGEPGRPAAAGRSAQRDIFATFRLAGTGGGNFRDGLVAPGSVRDAVGGRLRQFCRVQPDSPGCRADSVGPATLAET
jgi:hypothetical protein